MRSKHFLALLAGIVIVLIILLLTGNDSVSSTFLVEDPLEEIQFDKEKWNVRKGWGFAHRNAMLDDLVSDPEIRKLNRQEILALLGPPKREDGNYIFYMIDQKRALVLPMHTKSLVIKFTDQDSIEWMKIHE